MSIFNRKSSSFQISAMKRTRIPVFHRYWGASIFFGVLLGFPAGAWIWLQLNGLLPLHALYQDLKSIHVYVQIFIFLGLFVGGFSMQSGAHILGGEPPKSEIVIWFYPLIILGVFLKIYDSGISGILGQILISLGFFLLAITMSLTAIEGEGDRRIPIALPFVLGYSVLALAPWLDLLNPAESFFVLWVGTYSIILAAGQQLIANVLEGKRFGGAGSWLFAISIIAAAIAIKLEVFDNLGMFELTGILMILPILIYIVQLDLIPAMIRTGPTSLVLGFLFSVLWAISASVTLIVKGPIWDSILHQLVLGSITTMVIAVGTRVLGFFSGRVPMSETKLTLLVIGWQLVPFLRGWIVFLSADEPLHWFFIIWTETLITIWGALCFWRVMKVLKPDKV